MSLWQPPIPPHALIELRASAPMLRPHKTRLGDVSGAWPQGGRIEVSGFLNPQREQSLPKLPPGAPHGRQDGRSTPASESGLEGLSSFSHFRFSLLSEHST